MSNLDMNTEKQPSNTTEAVQHATKKSTKKQKKKSSPNMQQTSNEMATQQNVHNVDYQSQSQSQLAPTVEASKAANGSIENMVPESSVPVNIGNDNPLLPMLQDAFKQHDEALFKALPQIVEKTINDLIRQKQQQMQQPQNIPIPEGGIPPQGGGMINGLMGALPTLMQFIGASPANAFQEAFMKTMMDNAVQDMTFNRDFSRAFMSAVLKNVGGQMAATATATPINVALKTS